MRSREISVWIALGDSNYPVGRLWCNNRNGSERASFQYDDSWLNHPERFQLEPALLLAKGAFHTKAKQPLFGAFGDSAPDRWGRVLMRRAHARRARDLGESLRTLDESDFLLGVNDEARQGALRFSEPPGVQFLAHEASPPIPPLVDLPKLLSSTNRFLADEENAEDLRLLLAPGSSLGGARPKASVRDTHGQLLIAKFPHKDDQHNVVLWEAVALKLARSAHISVPQWRLETILEKPVLMLQRFDREGAQRIAFLSAMSMLQAADNESHSYLEIVESLRRYGASPLEDMAQLWRRIVFNILISNTDDHLRNHGFLYVRGKGWRLSPAYDMNPTSEDIKPRILSTTIDFDDGTASLDVALSVIKEFGLSMNAARAIAREVAASVANWRAVAKSCGLGRKEIEAMSSAFEHKDLEKGLALE